MIKLITLLHKRADLTREQFIARYENGHKQIGEKYLRSHASRYLRRYCRIMDSAILGGDELQPMLLWRFGLTIKRPLMPQWRPYRLKRHKQKSLPMKSSSSTGVGW